MAAAPKTNLGKMPCPNKGCDDTVALMKAANGNLSCKCQNADCEFSGYMLAHSRGAADWLSKVVPPKSALGTPPKAPAPKQEKEPEMPPNPQPPKAPAKGGFDLSMLGGRK